MLRHLPYRNAEGRKLRVVRVLGYKAHMGHNIGNTELFCKVGTVAEVFNARGAVFRRDKPQGNLTVVKIPYAGTLPAAPKCRNGNALFFNEAIHYFGVFIRPNLGLPGNKLAAVKAVRKQLVKLF